MTEEREAAHRPHRWWLIGGIVILVLAATGGVAAVAVLHNRAHVGQRFGASGYVYGDRHTVDIRVPSGLVQVEVTGPAGEASVGSPGSREVRAPLGGRFVEVEWDSGSNASAQTVGAVDIGGNHPVTLTLVAGGHRYRLDTFRTDALVDGSAVIAVDGDGDDLRIEATYAGVTQSVDPTTGTRRAGRADLLYNSGGWSPVVGDGAPSAKPRAKLQWQTSDNGGSAIRLAYVDGLGWAPKGSDWVVVDSGYIRLSNDVRWRPSRDSSAYVDYFKQIAKITGSQRVDGRPAVKVLKKGRVELGTWWTPVAVFKVPHSAGTVHVRRSTTFVAPVDYVQGHVSGYPKHAKITVVW
ncbi:hypothetical protein [Flexivirga oryzae]|uniref:Uncharacterized protein n=1 Tax=Flexivirga oryzae TaxID=1794944 RepID=A0A839NF15_9MICO|nr:hypothetical protein [Flexivirga oryzae]MBB2894524.1 hypothetical protein [Flexivirga oryzae]